MAELKNFSCTRASYNFHKKQWNLDYVKINLVDQIKNTQHPSICVSLNVCILSNHLLKLYQCFSIICWQNILEHLQIKKAFKHQCFFSWKWGVNLNSKGSSSLYSVDIA